MLRSTHPVLQSITAEAHLGKLERQPDFLLPQIAHL